jgi:hypothetical protein
VERIDTEAGATRLARAISADILLYNGDAIAKGQDVSAAIAEGRDLFRSRVTESHWHLFDTAFATMSLAAGAAPSGRAEHPEVWRSTASASTGALGSRGWVVAVIALAMLGAGIWATLTLTGAK